MICLGMDRFYGIQWSANIGYVFPVVAAAPSIENYTFGVMRMGCQTNSDFWNFHSELDKMNRCVDAPLDLSLKTLNEFKSEENDAKSCSPLDLSKSPEPPVIKKARTTSTSSSDSSDKENRPPKRYSCDMHGCFFTTNHKNDMRKHMYGRHIVSKPVECHKCGMKSKHSYSLKTHLAYCGKEPRFHCNFCSYKAHKKDHLQRHTRRQHNQILEVMPKFIPLYPPSRPISAASSDTEISVGVECPSCGKEFMHRGVMQRHFKACSANNIKCEYCPYKAKDDSIMKIHVSCTHPDVAPNQEYPVVVKIERV